MAARVGRSILLLGLVAGCDVAGTTGLTGRTTGAFPADASVFIFDGGVRPPRDAGAPSDSGGPADADPIVPRTMEIEPLFPAGSSENYFLNPELDPRSTGLFVFDEEFGVFPTRWLVPEVAPTRYPVLTAPPGIGGALNVLILGRAPPQIYGADVWIGSASGAVSPEIVLLGTDEQGSELSVELSRTSLVFNAPGVIWRQHSARFLRGFIGSVFLFVSGQGAGDYQLHAPSLTPWLEAPGLGTPSELRAGRPATEREKTVLRAAKRRFMDDLGRGSRPKPPRRQLR